MNRKTSTIIRGIMLALAVINQVLAACEAIPLSENAQMWYQLVSTVVTAVTSAVSYWYNNSFTQEAQEADKYLDLMKSGTLNLNEGDIE